MKGTEEALDVLGISGTVEKKANLPDGYDVETDYSYSKIQETIEESDSWEEFEEKISSEMDALQEQFEKKKEQVEKEKEEFENGDKVVLTGIHEGTQGRVNGYEVDRGHVFWHIYGLDGSDLGYIKTSALEKAGEEA